MHGLLRVFHDMLEYRFKMSFFSRGSNGRGNRGRGSNGRGNKGRHSNGRGNRGRGNWQRGHKMPQFSIHFDVDPQELNHLFQDRLFNLVGHGILLL
jgi:hypothetical protein